MTKGSSGTDETSKKAERNCRSWSQKEEATLMATVKELVVSGWKSDNGFRAGYLNKLETLCLDSNVHLMRHKVFPYFDDWKDIFGKDRATGENAEDIAESAADVRSKDKNGGSGGAPFDTDFSFENDLNEDAHDQVS